MPTTARSLASTTISQPAAAMRSPPAPKNSMSPVGIEAAGVGAYAFVRAAEWSSAARRCTDSISCAPYISPDASPAEIRIFTGNIVAAETERGSVGIRRRGRPLHTNFLIFVLQLVELVVDPALGQQLLMRPHLTDLA